MKRIQTTVYRLPCAGFAEKDGTFVNSARWLQWKNAALPPPGDARLDQDILAQIFVRVRALYQKDGGAFPDPILHARWPYTQPEHPALAEAAKEIKGQALADLTDPTGQSDQQIKTGQQLPGLDLLIALSGGIGEIGERLSLDLLRGFRERRMFGLRVRPPRVQDRIGERAAVLLVERAHAHEDLREDVLVEPRVARRRQRRVLPLQPSRGVDEGPVLLREAGAREAVDRRLDPLHLDRKSVV